MRMTIDRSCTKGARVLPESMFDARLEQLQADPDAEEALRKPGEELSLSTHLSLSS